MSRSSRSWLHDFSGGMFRVSFKLSAIDGAVSVSEKVLQSWALASTLHFAEVVGSWKQRPELAFLFDRFWTANTEIKTQGITRKHFRITDRRIEECFSHVLSWHRQEVQTNCCLLCRWWLSCCTFSFAKQQQVPGFADHLWGHAGLSAKAERCCAWFCHHAFWFLFSPFLVLVASQLCLRLSCFKGDSAGGW